MIFFLLKFYVKKQEIHRGYLIFSFPVIAMETLELKGTVGRRWKGRDKEVEEVKKKGKHAAGR